MTLYREQKPLSIKRTISMDDDTFVRLVRAADNRGIKYGTLMRIIINQWLEDNKV